MAQPNKSTSMKANIGRIVFALVFLVFGILHFMSGDAMVGYIPEWIPGGVFWIYLTGVGHLLAAIAILINKMASLAALLLAIMLIIFALTIHLPAALDGDMSNFLKDTGLAAAALYMSGHMTD